VRIQQKLLHEWWGKSVYDAVHTYMNIATWHYFDTIMIILCEGIDLWREQKLGVVDMNGHFKKCRLNVLADL